MTDNINTVQVAYRRDCAESTVAQNISKFRFIGELKPSINLSI